MNFNKNEKLKYVRKQNKKVSLEMWLFCVISEAFFIYSILVGLCFPELCISSYFFCQSYLYLPGSQTSLWNT